MSRLKPPTFFYSSQSLALARQRVQKEEWATQILTELKASAGKLKGKSLPVFESDWWEEASKKHWTEIYPEINHHTMFAVVDPTVQARDAALVWALTGDKEFLALARSVLRRYCDYRFFAKHPDVGLNWSVWNTVLLMCYELVFDQLDAGEHSCIEGLFTRALDAIVDNDQWWIAENPGGLYNNHFAWHKLWCAQYGLFFNKMEWLDYAFFSDQGMADLIVHGSTDDGLWFEGSINYQFTATSSMAILARILANYKGITKLPDGVPTDLWTHSFANGRRLIDLFTGPIWTMFPDGTLPTIGDCYGRRMRLNEAPQYYEAFDATGDALFAWLTSTRTKKPVEALFVSRDIGTPAPPTLKTRIWPEHKYVMLRSDSPDGFHVFMQYDKDTVHSHLDKLSIMAYGAGQHVLVDPEAIATAKHAFSSNVQKDLNRSSICHNLVMVDEKDHHPSSGLQLLQYVDSPDCKMATIADLDGILYPGVAMMRTTAVVPEGVIDVFQVTSETSHTYDYLLHLTSQNGSFDNLDGYDAHRTTKAAYWQWMKNPRSRRQDGPWSLETTKAKTKTKVTFAAVHNAEAITFQFPYKDDFTGVPVPTVMVRKKAKSVVFASFIQAGIGVLPNAKITVRDARHQHLGIVVDIGGAKRRILVDSIKDSIS